jgi:hypothetical protein
MTNINLTSLLNKQDRTGFVDTTTTIRVISNELPTTGDLHSAIIISETSKATTLTLSTNARSSVRDVVHK